MSEENLKSALSTLERKIKLMLSEQDKLKQDIQHFRTENERLKGVISEQEGQLKGFQNNSKISKIVDSMNAEGGDKEELKEVLDQYIKEIDKCIAHLGDA
jgi:septal ring factor EnvC (AmiA/AmiB activator)